MNGKKKSKNEHTLQTTSRDSRISHISPLVILNKTSFSFFNFSYI